jgi:hypothetical protein
MEVLGLKFSPKITKTNLFDKLSDLMADRSKTHSLGITFSFFPV